jgi:hypothetical protein
VSLTAVGVGSVLWNTGSTNPILTVSSAGTYSVTLTSGSGCTAVASAEVSADQGAPSVSITPSSTILSCASPSVSLTAVGVGSVLWNTGSTNPILTVSSAGTYSVTLTSGSGCSAVASAEVSADQTAPSVSISPSSATLSCASPSVSLTAVGVGSVLWNTGSTNPILTVSSAGTYSVTLTSGSGCSAVASAEVSADQTAPSVSISPSSATLSCASPSVSLTAVGVGSVLWNTGSTNPILTVSSAGTYSVTLTSGSGCSAVASVEVSQQSDQTIAFTQQPASSSSVTVGANVTTAVSVTGNPTAFQWYKDNLSNPLGAQTTSTLTLANAQLSDAGSYMVVVTGACNSLTSNAFSLSVTPVQSAPFAITAVTTVSCTPILPNRFSVSFTPRYSGLNGQPVSFSVANELLPTTESGPYTLQLYTDNPILTLKATQGGTPPEASFVYNWLEACRTTESPNTLPRVVNSLSSQTATAGTYFTYVIPEGTFTDTETPLSLRLSASGLPAGLGFVGATLSGIPSTTVGSPFTVSITATDPGGLSVSTPLLLTVLPATTTPPPTQPFAITGVTTISCTPVADRININFAPRYAGLTGQSIAFEVVNELAPTTDPAPYSLTLYRDNPVLTLKATQTWSAELASFSYNWLAACASVGQDNTPPRVNSPVGNQTALVGQGYSLNLANTFADQETPNQLTLVASGLPAGLSLVGTQISGTPSVSGVSTVVLTATDPGSLSVSTSFVLTVVGVGPSPLTVNLQASPNQFLTSGSTTLTANVSGGTSSYSYVFSGPGSINPTGNSATVSGLSAGVQTFVVMVSDATSPVSQTVTAMVSVTVSEPSNPPTGVFSITGVNTASCEVVSAGQRRLTFTPVYGGVTGQPINFRVVNELASTTASGPYSLNLYTDNPSITLKAVQQGSEGEASYVYNWLAVCSTGARVGVDAAARLTVEVLGNPVVSDHVEVLIKGAGNQEVGLRVLDTQGSVVSERTVGSIELAQPQTVQLGQPAGQYILQVSTPTQRQTVKILKR